MSRPTLSTGSIDLSARKQRSTSVSQSARGALDKCHIAVLADFTGRSHRGLNDAGSIAERSILEVDRDNFDDVFTRLKVVFDSPLADSAIEFTELDDLHPDYLYQRMPAFDKFKSLRRRLKNNSSFAEAAAEVQAWCEPREAGSADMTAKNLSVDGMSDSAINLDRASNNDTGSLLDQLLAEPVARQTAGDFDVKKLVREIMSPYIVPQPDPRQKDLLAAVDEASSQLMRKILHNSDFQKIEASWRSLYMLIKRLDTDAKLKIFIIDISQQEVIDDASIWQTMSSADDDAHPDVSRGALGKLLFDSRSAAGADPFAMILADYPFSDALNHAQALEYLAEIGAQSGTAVLSGGSERVAGCQSLADSPDIDDWNYQTAVGFTDQWQSFRESPASHFLALIAPRFLLRLPYGKKLSRTEQFAFEELPANNSHHYYLWANGAWLACILVAESFSEFGWNFTPGKHQQIDRLPIHVFTDEDGDSQMTPCAEIMMTDRTATRLGEAGIMAVRSVYQKDAVLIPDFISVHAGDPLLRGPWR